MRYQHASELRADLKRLSRDTASGKASRRPASQIHRHWSRKWALAAIPAACSCGSRRYCYGAPRSLPAPRILNTTQLTHDGMPKMRVLTDGARLYVSEMQGNKQILVQASTAGGRHPRSQLPSAVSRISTLRPITHTCSQRTSRH